MEGNEIQNKSGIAVNVNASTKRSTYVRKNIFRILLHVVAKL